MDFDQIFRRSAWISYSYKENVYRGVGQIRTVSTWGKSGRSPSNPPLTKILLIYNSDAKIAQLGYIPKNNNPIFGQYLHFFSTISSASGFAPPSPNKNLSGFAPPHYMYIYVYMYIYIGGWGKSGQIFVLRRWGKSGRTWYSWEKMRILTKCGVIIFGDVS